MVAKKQTKKDLEAKIAELEEKLSKLSSQLSQPAETKQESKPKPAEKPASSPRGSLPKGMGQQKPAETKQETKPEPKKETAQPPATIEAALEDAYMNAPMTDFHDYRTKVTGYSPAPNRYFVRRTAPVGKVPPQPSWNEQKTKVTGYTQPSNQYFATRARLAYHPPEKTFGGYGLKVEGAASSGQKAETQTAPPPKPKQRGTLPKGF